MTLLELSLLIRWLLGWLLCLNMPPLPRLALESTPLVSVLGSAVWTRIAPPVVLRPNSVPCGPLSTWTLRVLSSCRSVAIGLGE